MSQTLSPKVRIPAIVVIDSMELRRAGVVSLLGHWANDINLKIVEIDRYEALAQSSSLIFKMVVLVIGASGIGDPKVQDCIIALRERYSDTPLVLVSEREDPDEVVAAFQAGARGFIPMSIKPPMVMNAFAFIMGGGSYFPPAALMQRAYIESSVRVVAGRASSISIEPVRGGLTARQQEVLERLRQGESNKLIGRQLKLRESTVKVHVRQIMRKLGATNRTQAALSAVQLALSTRDKADEPGGSELGGAKKHLLQP